MSCKRTPKILPRHQRAEAEKSNPRSEFFIPNDAANRRGESPYVGCSDGAPYAIDHAALCYADSVRTLSIGHKDPLQSVELLVQYQAREGFSRERSHCNSCRTWDTRGGWGLDAKRRPPGVHDPDSCDGCVLSFLDAAGQDPREIQDRLYNEWAELRVLLDRNVEQNKLTLTAAEKKHVTEERRRLSKRLATAKGACGLAGFDPAKRRRSLARQTGEVPTLAAHHDRSRNFPPAEQREVGPHWRHQEGA